MNQSSRVRLFTLQVLVVSLLIALFGRLWYLQVLAGDQYAKAAVATREHDIVTTATRGEILDDWGRPYAENKTQLVVSVNYLQLHQQKDEGYAVETRLANLLHEDVRSLVDSITPCTYNKVPGPDLHVASPPGCWSGAPYQPIPVSENADTDQALQILEQQDLFPGVTASVQSIRQYEQPMSSTAANLIGYEGKVTPQQYKTGAYTTDALTGAAGIEEQYETSLRGTNGVQKESIDRQGKVVGQISNTDAVPGDNVVLSIDAGVQGLLENVLSDAVNKIAPNQQPVPGNNSSGPTHPTTAVGVVMNAQTGQVVASASYPSYDPKLFQFPRTDAANAKIASLNKNPNHPLLNQAIQGQFAPGSTFKLITTSAELNSGEANWGSKYDCEGSLIVGGKPKSNSEGEALGKIDLQTTIAQSCDTVYYQFALDDYKIDYTKVVKQHGTANENVTKMAKEFGLDAATGVDLPSESTGLIPTWAKTKQLAIFYHDQQCLGAYGGKDANGKKVKPNPDKAQRAKDKKACDTPLQSYDEILYPGNYADEYIGQGTVLATPLQMAVAYSALVNGGKIYSPKVAKAVVTPDGKLVKAIKPQVQRVLDVSQDNLSQIQQAMYKVVTNGTAKDTFAGFPLNQVLVGGKTGTAQVQDAKTKQITDTSVFASFAGTPGQKPQYVSIILVPKGGYGADVAGPATRLLWDGMYGLEGKTNVLPKGLLDRLPVFSKDGNLVTKGPKAVPGSPTPNPSGSAGATPTVGTAGLSTAGATTVTTTPPAVTTTTPPAAPTTTAVATRTTTAAPPTHPTTPAPPANTSKPVAHTSAPPGGGKTKGAALADRAPP